jgi:hypothetical protein
LCENCLIRVTSMHYIKSIRMFEGGVMSSEHALVIQGGSLGGLGWWSDACNLQNFFAFCGLSQYFDQASSFCLLVLRFDCECNRPSFVATAFQHASAFNGDLNQWDVAKVGAMLQSKSTRIGVCWQVLKMRRCDILKCRKRRWDMWGDVNLCG